MEVTRRFCDLCGREISRADFVKVNYGRMVLEHAEQAEYPPYILCMGCIDELVKRIKKTNHATCQRMIDTKLKDPIAL